MTYVKENTSYSFFILGNSSDSSVQEIAKELLNRRRARVDFWSYCLYMDYEFFSKRPFLETIAIKFQDVADGKLKKLMVSLPPRSGKSYITSMFSSWMLAKNPEGSIMRNSYGSTLAEKFSFDVRTIIKSNKYNLLFPTVKLMQDKHAIEDWAITTAKQTSYFCAGVGGAITGKGCNILAILDDPIKNLEDALSETILEKTWNWYVSTHKSRIEKGCPEIIIATRWSKKDPIGVLLEEEKYQWEEIKYSALTSEGKSFCEEVKTTEEYIDLKNIMDAFIWEAEFQQNPIESKGLLFPPADLNYFEMKEIEKYINPESKQYADFIIGYTDTADEGTDYLASGTLVGIGSKYFLTDVVFTQDPIEVTMPLVAGQIIATNQTNHTFESNNGGKGFALEVRRILREADNLCNTKWILNTKNKETRILMHSGLVKKHFYFRSDVALGSQYADFIKFLTSYVRLGKNTHDDAGDLVTGLAELVFRGTSFRFLNSENNN